MSVPYATRRVREFLEAGRTQCAGPVFRVHDLIRLHAEQAGGAHQSIFVQRGECIEVIIVVRK